MNWRNVFQEPVVPCSSQVKNQVRRRCWVYHRVKGSADLRLWCRKWKWNQMYFLKKKYQQLTVLAAVTPSAIGSTSTRDCFPTFSEKEDWIKIGKLLKVNRTLPLKTRYTFIFFKRIQRWLLAFVQIHFQIHKNIFKIFSFRPLPLDSCQDILEQPEQPHSPLENLSRPQPLRRIQIGIDMRIWWSHAHHVLFETHPIFFTTITTTGCAKKSDKRMIF